MKTSVRIISLGYKHHFERDIHAFLNQVFLCLQTLKNTQTNVYKPVNVEIYRSCIFDDV